VESLENFSTCPVALDAFRYRPGRRLRRYVNPGIRGVSNEVLVAVIVVPTIILTFAEWIGRDPPEEKTILSAIQMGGEPQ